MLRKIVFSAVALIPIGLARLAFNTVSLRAFGEAWTGALNIALALAVLFALPASSFGTAAVRFIAHARGRSERAAAAHAFRVLLALGAVTAVISAVALAWLRPRLESAADLPLVVFEQALLLVCLYAIYLYAKAAAYAFDQVERYTRIELVGGLVFAIGLSSVVLGDYREHGLLPFVLSYGFVAAGCLFLLKDELRPGTAVSNAEAPAATGTMIAFALTGLVGTGASMAVREVGTILSAGFSSLEDTAHLALCLAVLAPLHFVPRALRTVLFAASAELDGQGDRASISRAFTETNHWLSLAAVPLCTGLILLAEPIITLFGGQPTPERVLVFQLLALCTTIDVLPTTAVNALVGVGRIRVTASSGLFGLVACIVVWAWSGEQSLMVIALGFFAASVVRASIPIWYARRTLGIVMSRAPMRLLAMVALGFVVLAIQFVYEHLAVVLLVYGVGIGLLLAGPVAELRGRVRREAGPA